MRAVKAAKDAAAEKTEGSDDDEEWNLNVDEHSDGDSDEQFAITASKVPASTKTSPASKDDGRRPQRKLSAQAVSARDRLHVKMATALTFDDPIQRKAAAASGSSDALEVVHSAPAESVDANAAWLTLTSDLSGELPSSFWLDFEVGGVDEATSDGVRLALLVDGAAWTHSERHHVEIAELAPGYHLLRAFLVDRRSGCCVKSRSAYVEAEFRVAGVSAAAAAPRGFMFGQPAICAIARPDPIAWRGGDEPIPIVCDFFVSNCALGDAAEGGCSVRILIDDDVVATARAWAAHALRLRLPAAARQLKTVQLNLRYEIVSPLGEVLRLPAYSMQAAPLTVRAS